MLEQYFATKIGSCIIKKIVTGDTFYTSVYERVFKIEVIGIEDGKLYVHTKSYDKVPSGYVAGGTDRDLGETTIDLKKHKTKEGVIFSIIQSVDGAFIHRFKVKAV